MTGDRKPSLDDRGEAAAASNGSTNEIEGSADTQVKANGTRAGRRSIADSSDLARLMAEAP
jgi:hypothetical protein